MRLAIDTTTEGDPLASLPFVFRGFADRITFKAQQRPREGAATSAAAECCT
jgi:hypothetical protein